MFSDLPLTFGRIPCPVGQGFTGCPPPKACKMLCMPPQAPSPHPTLDKFKAELAGMSPEQRKQAFLLLAQLVKQRVQAAADPK